jgi:hypothetical protein
MSAYTPNPFAPLGANEIQRGAAKVREPDDWQPMPVPEDEPDAPAICHPGLGNYSCRWAYHNADGSLAGHVCRFDRDTGKQMRPLRYGRLNGRTDWQWKGWAGDDAKPLYRRPELTASPDAPFVLCEGEKSADAAAELLGPQWVAIASMNGAKSPQSTDWSPLAGRKLVIWPDNDQPGQDFAFAAGTLALKAGASSVKIVELPEGLPESWDLADPIPEGMELDAEALLQDANEFDPNGEEQGTFRVQWNKAGELMPGLHYKVVQTDDETGEKTPGWHWFGSRVDVLAHSRDDGNRKWGRYIAVHDNDRNVHYFAMPMAMTASDGTEHRRELLDRGMILAPGKTTKEQLEIYLTTWKPKKRVRCVDWVGWHGGAFVLPDRTFGSAGETVILQTEKPAKAALAGSLAKRQQNVAALAVGNSRIAFAISAAFAGPLLQLLSAESGGFHFKGGSSIGKTSALHASCSVWGYELHRWRTTDNAAEATAARVCDAFHTLDELSQAEPRAVDAMAYMLANGTGKNRAIRSGGAREAAGASCF